MKILYAIQGTGNGHVSRARDIIPILSKKGDLDILISGTQADIVLPHTIKYKCKGMGFIFGKNGGVDLYETYKKIKFRQFHKEVKQIPIENYDLIINDFEPVTAWGANIKKLPCIALSHQCAVLSPDAPRPKNFDILGPLILKSYAPATAEYGFHFNKFAENIFTPVIRSEIRQAKISNKGHYTVYLPSYDDKKIIEILQKIKNVKWEVFSKYSKCPVEYKNIIIKPIDNSAFVNSLISSEGILCGAGFESPAEALFLNKKLLVIPMKNQYEQHCNAAALKLMGVPVVKSFKKKYIEKIDNWVASTNKVTVDYKDNTEEIIDMIINKHS